MSPVVLLRHGQCTQPHMLTNVNMPHATWSSLLLDLVRTRSSTSRLENSVRDPDRVSLDHYCLIRELDLRTITVCTRCTRLRVFCVHVYYSLLLDLQPREYSSPEIYSNTTVLYEYSTWVLVVVLVVPEVRLSTICTGKALSSAVCQRCCRQTAWWWRHRWRWSDSAGGPTACCAIGGAQYRVRSAAVSLVLDYTGA